MRRMIGAFALAVAALSSAAPLEAQAQRGGRDFGMNVDEQMAVLTERLELNEEQAAKVREILQAQIDTTRERFQEMRSGSASRGGVMQMVQELQEETETKLAEVLSDEQMEQYREWVAEQRQRRRPPPF